MPGLELCRKAVLRKGISEDWVFHRLEVNFLQSGQIVSEATANGESCVMAR